MTNWTKFKQQLINDFNKEIVESINECKLDNLFEYSIDITDLKKKLNRLTKIFNTYSQFKQTPNINHLYKKLNNLYGKTTAFQFVSLANGLLTEAGNPSLIDDFMKAGIIAKTIDYGPERLNDELSRVFGKHKKGYEDLNNAYETAFDKTLVDFKEQTVGGAIAAIINIYEKLDNKKLFNEYIDIALSKKLGAEQELSDKIMSLKEDLGGGEAAIFITEIILKYARDIKATGEKIKIKEKEKEEELKKNEKELENTIEDITSLTPEDFGDLPENKRKKAVEIIMQWLQKFVTEGGEKSIEDTIKNWKKIDKKTQIDLIASLSKDSEIEEIIRKKEEKEEEKEEEEEDEFEFEKEEEVATVEDKVSEHFKKIIKLYREKGYTPEKTRRSIAKAFEKTKIPGIKDLFAALTAK